MNLRAIFRRLRAKRYPSGTPSAFRPVDWAPLLVPARAGLEQDIAIFRVVRSLLAEESEFQRIIRAECETVAIASPALQTDKAVDQASERILAILVSGQLQFLEMSVKAAVEILQAITPGIAADFSTQPTSLQKAEKALRALRRIESEHVISPS